MSFKINDKRKSIRKHPTKKPSKRSLNQITHIAIHHSLTTSGSAEAFANYHVGTNGWSVMSYTYVVNRDGSIDWCSDYEVVTPHVGNHNKYSLGICMVGDFRTQNPTKEQYESTLWLVNYVQGKLPNKCKVWGHQNFKGYEWKNCPAIDMNKFREDVVNYKSQPKYIPAKVSYNGKSVESLLIEGQNFVQLRSLAEFLGCQIGYNSKTKEVTFNNQVVKPKIIEDRSYLHIREACKILGLQVKWDSSTQTAEVYK